MAPRAHQFPELTHCTMGKSVYPAIQEKWRGLNWFSPELSVPT